jgi:hypothetical protein
VVRTLALLVNVAPRLNCSRGRMAVVTTVLLRARPPTLGRRLLLMVPVPGFLAAGVAQSLVESPVAATLLLLVRIVPRFQSVSTGWYVCTVLLRLSPAGGG